MNPIWFDDKLKEILQQLEHSFPYRHTYVLNVKHEHEGLTLLELYTSKFDRIPESIWLDKIQKGEILVNGQIQASDYKLKAGEQSTRIELIESEPAINYNIKLLYIDDEILVIDKPSPLPSQASGRFIQSNLFTILEKVFGVGNIFPVHRLDANTTGIIVFGHSKNYVNILSNDFKKHLFSKTYISIIEGIINTYITIDSEIDNSKETSGSRKLGEGQSAKTEVKPIQIIGKNTLIEINPETGRTNQIRLHLASIGHPILGDIGYSDLKYFKNNPMTYESDTLFLHAWKLKFTHPKTKKELSFEAEIPEKFKRLMNQK